MKKLNRGQLLLSTCLTGIALATATGAQAQDKDPNWKPRAEVDARASDGSSQVSFELFAPVAQNDSNLMFVAGRIGTDERYDRNGSVTIGGRGKIGDDVAIGVNAGIDFYKSDLSKRDQTAVSFGLEGFTSVFDVRVNYRLPVTNRYTIGYLDPNASPVGVLSVENNRLIERKSGWRLEDVPLGGANAEIGATAPLGNKLSVRASAAGFDYRDDHASKAYRGVRGGLELGVEDPLGSGGRFSLGAELQNDNRWGTQARGTVRLSIPLGRGSADRSAGTSGLDRQMGDRVRRDYVTPSGTRYTDLTSTSFAIDNRTGVAFGGVYFTSGAGVAGAAGTSTATTTLGDAITRAGANGIVVALGNAGNIASGGVTLATNQYLVGGASSVDVRHANGSVTAFSFGGTNGTIVGSNAGGAAVTLGQGSVVRDVTVRGAGSGILANGVGGFALERVIIENTGAAGLTLNNTTGAVVIDGITIRGGAGAGVVVNGGSNVTLRNSTIGGGAGAIDINDAGGNLTTTLSSLTLSATGGTVLDIDGSGAGTVTVAGLSGINILGGNGETGGFAARFVTFDSSTAAGIQAVNAGTMQVGTAAARVGGAGVTLTEVDGALTFGTLNVFNNGGTGLTVNNTKSGTFTLTNTTGTVNTTAGTALNLDPLLIDLNFTAVSSTGATGAGIVLSHVQGAGTGGNALTIGTLTITNSGQQGLFITGGSTGLVTIGGGTITNSGGASVQVGESGLAGSGGTIGLNFGAAITDTGAGPLVSIFNIGGAIRFTGAISGAGPVTIGNTLAGSSVTFTGATTITGSTSPAISLDNLAGSTTFSGLVTIANPLGTGIVIGTVPGGVTFGDVDITGLGAATGVNFTGTQGNVTFATLDISGTGAAGSTGIDLTGATNAGAITITNGSTIQGVDIGVNLTNANISGSFRYGDANAANGLQSRITANTVIVVAGMNATQGTYNFADVVLDGNTNNITGGSFTAYYVLAGATGAGTANDPGSIAGAAASGAQYIVLLNNPTGGQDVIDTTGLVGGALSLTAGQSLVSFLNTDFFAVTGATVPANLIVTNLGPTGIVNTYAGSGAAILTSSTGGSTLNLANDSRVDGVIIHNDALGVGVVGTGVSNAIIRNSTISGNGGAVSILAGGAAASVTLSNLNLSSSGGTTLLLDGSGAGTVNASGTGINITATGSAQGLAINDVTVGTIDIGAVTTGNASGLAAVQVTNAVGGTVNIGSVSVGGATTGVGLGVANNSATVNVGAVSATNTAGIGVVVSGNTGNVTLGAVTVANTGSDGVRLTNNSGTVSVGAVTSTNAGGSGIRVNNTTGNVAIASASVTGAADGIEVANLSGALTVGATSIANSTGVGILINGVGGTVSFGATTIANSTGIELGAGSTGTITFGDTDITGLGANMTGVDARAAGGTVTFATLDITGTSTTGTRGIDLTGATFAGNLTVSDSSTITGVGTGVDLTNAAITGNFRFGDGSNTDADGAHSVINAITPIAIGGLNQTVGGYNFSDVNLVGDTTNLAINPITVFFVEQGRTGAGTKVDPGSLAAAAASGANYIVLLNNPTGGNDVLDVLGLGTLTLGANQHLVGFLHGDTQTVGGGTPANLFLYGITQGIVTNPYAGSGSALLTNSGAGATVTLSNGSSIDGVRIGGAGIGVYGSGVTNVSITNSVISGSSGAIDLRSGGVASSAQLGNLALSATGGTAFNLSGVGGGSLTLSGSGLSVSATGNARALAADTVTLGGNLVFSTVSTGTAGGAGVSLANIGGSGALVFSSINIGGTTGGATGLSLAGNSAGINLGAVTVASSSGDGIAIIGNTGNVVTSNFAVSDALGTGLRIEGLQGVFTASGGSVSNSETGIVLTDIDGQAAFLGGVTISNPRANGTGIRLGAGSGGQIGFADVDITGLGANMTGLDARSASGTVSFGTLDITGTGVAGSTGIDLTGATFAGSLIINGSSTISGVTTGVNLTNAAITGSFRFGDGSNTDANGAGSTIDATTPLLIAGLNALQGNYDFADVNLVGDTAALSTSATIYWVVDGGTGDGTRGTPGNLAGAAASGADIIILVNNPAGGNDTIDAGAGLTLITGQQLRGFLYGDTIAVPGGAPTNIVLYNIAQGIVTNPFAGSGAPTLTTTAGAANTVTVVGNNLIDGVIIANGGTGSGVTGSGANVTISNSQISGSTAIDFSDGGINSSIALSNLRLWSGNGAIVLGAYAFGGGTTTVTQLSNVVIEGGHGEGGGAFFQGATFDADLGTAGFQTVDATLTVGTSGARVAGTGGGLDLANTDGALNFTALSIYNTGGIGLASGASPLALSSSAGTIDTINGTTISLGNAQTDLVLDNVVHAGTGSGVAINGITGIGTGGRALQIGNLTASSTDDIGVRIAGNNNGAISFGAASAISNTAQAAIALSSGTGTLNFSYDGSVTQPNNAALLNVTNHNGTVTFGATSTLSATNGTGLEFDNADGTYNFAGTTTLTGGSQIGITNGSAGSFTFGSGTSITDAAGADLYIANSTANLTYSGSISQSQPALVAVDIGTHSGGMIDFTGATFNVTGGAGLSFFDADGTYKFGNLALSGGSRLTILGGSAGTFTFGNVDITGLAANTTAVNLTGATGNVAFATLDITGASTTGTRGINLTGSTTAGNVIVSGSSQITGVGIGVDLTNAAITGNFRYGDGSNTDGNGAASNITAVTPLVIAGLNGGTGTYNFADVNLNGDTTNLSVSAYFVLEGATGTGTRSDPGSLAGAEASGATYIVLLNNPNGGTDILDATANAGGSLDLAGGQSLFSFRDTDSFAVGGGAPANVVLFNVQTGVISNPFAGSGAPTLTASGANATVILGGGNVVDGVVIANSGTGAGILGNGAAAPLTIRNSTVSGGAAGAIRVYDNTANVALALSNLTLAANGGNILNLDGSGTGSFILSQLSNISVVHTTETGGFVFNDLTFDADTVTAGLQAVNAGNLTLGTTGSRITGTGLSLTNVTGTLNFGDLNIANNGGTGLIVANSKANNFVLGTTGGAIDTTNGTAINLDPLTINMVLGSVRSTGGAYGLLLDQVEGSFTVTGAVNISGATDTAIVVRDNNAQTDALDVHFQGAVAINNTTGAGVSLTNNTGATVDFAGGLGITTTTGTGFTATGGGTLSVAGGASTITTGDAAGLTLNGVTVAAAGVNFDNVTAAPTLATAIAVSNVNLAGALNFGGLDIDATNTAVLFNTLTGTGGVNFTGTLDIDSGIGFTFVGSLGTINIANTGGSSLTIDGAQQAIRFISVTSGTVNVASAGGNAAISGSTGFAIGVNGDTGGTLTYGGTANVSQGAILSAQNSVAGVTLSGTLTSIAPETAFNFLNADGTYLISGSVSDTGGTAVAVDAASSGAITFSGASKVFSAGSLVAVSMAGTGTLSFTSGGLDIDTAAGTGLSATGGTLVVTGANNTIDTTTGQILGLVGVTSGIGGINFASLTATGTVANNGILLSNLTGAAFNGGTVNIGGTSGAANDGIKVSTGTAAITFGTTTIGAAGSNAIELLNSASAVTFGAMNLTGANANTVEIAGATAPVTFGTGTITATGAANYAVSITGGTGDVTVGSTLGGTRAVEIVDHETGTVTFSGNMSSTVLGITVSNSNSGLITFTGQSLALGGTGVILGGNSGGTIDFNMAAGGNGLDISGTGTGFSAGSGGTVIVRGTGNSINMTGTSTALSLQNVTIGAGGFNFDGVSTTQAATGILFNGVSGNALNLGTVNLQGVTSNGVQFLGILGSALTINDLDIGLNSNSAVALNLNAATINAPILVGDFDVTNAAAAGTSIAVDLRGTTGGSTISLGTTPNAIATITGVGTGVYLNASTNALFTYGDGEAGTDTASTISADTAINATNAPTLGTYDFRDISFNGSPGSGFGLGKIYYVNSTGGGSGLTGGNPMTLAAAESAAVSEDIIVLVNDGNAISTAGSNGNNWLNLAAGVSLLGFGDGVGGGAGSGSAPITVSLIVPSTILLSGGTTINIADPTGNGAATLTSSSNAQMVVNIVGSNHLISGFILDGNTNSSPQNVQLALNGSSITGLTVSNLTVRRFWLSSLNFSVLNGAVFNHLKFDSNSSNDISVTGTNMTLNDIVSSGAGGYSIGLGPLAGTTTLSNFNISGGQGALSFTNSGGTVNATNIQATGGTDSTLGIFGGNAIINFDATSTFTQALGGTVLKVAQDVAANTGTLNFAGTISATNGGGMMFNNADGTYNFTGTTTLNGGDAGIDIVNGSAGTFTFGTGTSITSPSGNAFDIANSTANVTYNGSITQANNAALLNVLNHSGGTLTFNTGTLSATNGTGLQFNNADGTYNFAGTTTLNGGDAGVDITNGSVGTFGFGTGTAITHAAAGDAFVMSGSNAALLFEGSINDSNGHAVNVDSHNAGTLQFDGAITANGANATGISLTNNAGGTILFNGQVALTTGANNALTMTGNAGSTATFNAGGNGLDIVTTSGTGLLISGGGTINVQGANNSITTGSGTLLDISNATVATTALNLNFASASNSSGANGILVSRTSGMLTGSVNIAGGTITASTRGVDLDGDALTFTYAGSIATTGTTGRSVEVTNRTSNFATFSGNITDAALGINIANNTGGTVYFTGQSISLATVANATALTLASNTGASIMFGSAGGGNGFDIVASGTGTGISFTGGGTLDITGGGNTVQTATGQILNLVNGTVGGAGLTFDSLTSTGPVAATAININNLDGGTLNGGTVNIAGTSGAGSDGIFYGGGSTTNMNFGSTTISATADEGIEISGAGNGSFTASSVTINDTGGNGVEINGATNSVSLAGGAIGATNDPTGFGVYVLNGTGVVSISSSITKTTVGNVVFVDNHETGNVTFSGNISATGGTNNGIVVQNVNSGAIQFSGITVLSTGANTAVNLLNNTGGTISFPNGSLSITTSSGAGFSATGGGNVDVQGNNSTITSASGTALNIVNTNIGSAGVNFRSISSNGAASGIILNNTGSAGGLRVVGTGAAGSGGTIQNSAGDGISLTSTENVRLAYMNVTNNLGDGIGGSNVNGFVIDNLLISGNGNDNGTDESGINITELTGGGSASTRPTGIFNSTIQNNNEFEVQITNSTGTLTNFQIVNSNIASNGNAVNANATPAHGNLVNFLGTGTSSMGLTVTGSTFTGNWNPSSPPAVIVGSGLFVDSSGTAMTANVSTSNFYNLNNGINVSTGPGSTTLTYSIIGNTITGSRSTAINDFQNGNAPFSRTVYGTIQNNIIGTNGVAMSGSQLGNGISISNEGSVNATYLISGNTIQQVGVAGTSGSSAIAVNVGLVGQATFGGTTNVTITNNTIRDILNSRGIVVNNNQNTGTLPTIRLSMSNNQFLGTIAGQAGNGQFIRLSDSGGGPFFVTQQAATASAIASELDDANGFNDTSKVSIGTGTFTYGAAAPTLPPAVVPLP